MPDFQISCIFLVSGTESANAVPKVLSPLLYVLHNGSALLEKSAKILKLIFFVFGQKKFMYHISGYFEGPQLF